MKRSGFKRSEPKPGEPRSSLSRGSELKRGTELKRSKMKRKPRRAKPGDEPAYKRFVKAQPCCVREPRYRCRKSDPHHLIDGDGDARKGMGQTAPDRYLLPLCRKHHDEFHEGKGIFTGWDDAMRLTFQEQECERLREIWRDLCELGVLQEPERRAI